MEADREHRIIRVAATPVSVPRITPLKSALGLSSRAASASCGVETDAGVIGGLGEISMIWNGDGAALCPMVNDLLGPALIGRRAFDINAAHQLMDKAVQFSRAANPAKAAVDMALYDIVGKALERPSTTCLAGGCATPLRCRCRFDRADRRDGRAGPERDPTAASRA